MKRREFLKTSGLGMLVPFLGLELPEPKPEFLHELQDKNLRIPEPQPLRFERFRENDWLIPDGWQLEKLRISKGPFSAESHCCVGQDLLDCHGLCATVEWAHLLKEQLEYPTWALRKILGLGFDCPEEKRQFWRKHLRRVEITQQEFAQIVLFLDQVRGPHDCVHRV